MLIKGHRRVPFHIGGRSHGAVTTAIVNVEVQAPERAVDGTLTHQPMGVAMLCPPMVMDPRPVPAAVS
ncbi:MAG: hypothetical protein QOJ44_2436 [Acidimicrobiaceae bacterium]|nr:hypothetical protein [Acidimicrobiaceae bacterium]